MLALNQPFPPFCSGKGSKITNFRVDQDFDLLLEVWYVQ